MQEVRGHRQKLRSRDQAVCEGDWARLTRREAMRIQVKELPGRVWERAAYLYEVTMS